MYHQALEQERQKLVDQGEGYKREREKLVQDNARLAALLSAGDPSAEASVLQVYQPPPPTHTRTHTCSLSHTLAHTFTHIHTHTTGNLGASRIHIIGKLVASCRLQAPPPTRLGFRV